MSFSSFITINKQYIFELNMRLQQIQNSYLYEGLDKSSTNTMLLWESAGFKLREAALSPDQIQQIFAAVEKGATDSGSNRTMLGKGKDAASAVNQAWEDLKTKVQNSGPIKAVDQKYDDVVAKIEAGLGGPDNKVNQVIQKYRAFAKDRPIAQGLIYAALIAAAGISGAGLGGAAVLGLLKMTDKLLQGEKFSSAAYTGAKTGALAYGASKLGDLIRGEPKGTDGSGVSDNMQKGLEADQAFQDRITNKYPSASGHTYSANGDSFEVFNAEGKKVFSGDIPLKTMDMETFADLTNNGKMINPGISSGAVSSDPMAGVSDKGQVFNLASNNAISNIDDKNAKYAWQMVQQKVDTGELTDPKAVSSELNKSLNKAFSDYGVNPNSPEAEASKNAAKEVIAKAKDPEALLGKMQSGEVRPAGPAPDTLKGADALKAASDTATGSSDPFTVNGQTMKASLRDTIMKMSDEDGETAYNAWKVLVGGDSDTQSKMGAGQLLQQLEKKYAKSESINRSNKRLSEGQVYLVFNKVCSLNESLLVEGVLKEGPLDTLKGFAAKGLQKAQTVGKNLTTKVTADKLNKAWQKAGAPADSNELASFLTAQGVNSGVVDNVYQTLKIAKTSNKAQKTKQSNAVQSTGTASSYAEVKAQIMKLDKKGRQRLMTYLNKQIGTV